MFPRLILVVLLLVFAIVGCSHDKLPAKKEQKSDQSVDVGNPNEPLQIRGLKGAKELKKDIEAQQKEQGKDLDQ